MNSLNFTGYTRACVCVYIYIYIYIRRWPGILGFNPMSSHTKDSKMVLDTSLVNIQYYKVEINGERSNPWKGVVAFEKGAFESRSTTLSQLKNVCVYIYIYMENTHTHTHTHTHTYIYIYIYMCVCVSVCFTSLHDKGVTQGEFLAEFNRVEFRVFFLLV